MPSQSPLILSDAYERFLTDLKTLIKTSQIKAALAVNSELIKLYWKIGRDILHRQQQEGWGSKVIDRLSQDLKREFPTMKGFSPRNLKYMRAFAEANPDQQIVQEVLAQITWYHNIALLEKLKVPETRYWYAQQTVIHGWSRNILVMQIENGLFERQGNAINNFQQTLPPEQTDLSHSLLKDPYNFDFLTLQDAYQERDLEQALIVRIRDFLLELGVGFAFVGSQYRLEVEGDEFFLDMLLYHVKLHRYVVLELKVTDFKPEYAGKMNFYITAVNQLLCGDRDDPTIGIILCRSKKQTIVEFALGTVQNPIGVSTYKLRDELPPALQESLPTVEQLEMELDTAFQELKSQSNTSFNQSDD
ncbi:MAG: PDDEXK nuclease domain-containing protein [Cyanobacteria bacterium P01_D01_bin.156]